MPSKAPTKVPTAAPTVSTFDVSTIAKYGMRAAGSKTLSTGDMVIGGTVLSGGNNKMFVRRYNSGSSTPIWTTLIGTANSNNELDGLAVDGSNNIYITGYCDYDAAGFHGKPMQGMKDVCIAKLSQSGALLNTMLVGGAGNDWGNGITVMSNVVYICGVTTSSTFPTYPADATEYSQIGGSDSFILKLNTNLGLLSNYQYGTAGGKTKYRDIVAGPASSLFVVGAQTVNFYSQPNHGKEDFLLQKISSSGAVQWTKQLGGSLDDEGFGVALDAASNVYAAGFSSSYTAGGTKEIMVVKFPNGGGTGGWTKYFNGGSDLGNDVAFNLEVDSTHSLVYVVGSTTSTSFYGASNPSGRESVAFLALTLDGVLHDSNLFTSSNIAAAENVATNGEEIYVVGSFKGSFQGVSSSSDSAFMMQLGGYPSGSRRLMIDEPIEAAVDVVEVVVPGKSASLLGNNLSGGLMMPLLVLVLASLSLLVVTFSAHSVCASRKIITRTFGDAEDAQSVV
jgi:hypothetical protein